MYKEVGLGAKLLEPYAREVWGLETMTSGETGSAPGRVGLRH